VGHAHTPSVTDPQVPSVDEAQLRAQSDAFNARLDELLALEDRKRNLSPVDPEFVSLALEVEQLAAGLLDTARKQTELGDAAHREGVATPIVDVPADASAHQILMEWRAAERQIATASPGSEASRQLRAQIESYRRAYQKIFEDRSRS
jgi:DNA repair exonuclease SbcCD ATPase subunit